LWNKTDLTTTTTAASQNLIEFVEQHFKFPYTLETTIITSKPYPGAFLSPL